jgi:RND family efflux transporter MFP subunit
MKKIIAIIAVIAIVVFAVLKLKSSHDKISATNLSLENMTVVTVDVATVKKVVFNQAINLVGVLKADKEIDIASEIQGKIVAVNFKEGDFKNQGAVIVAVDDKLKQLALQSAKVSYEKLKKDFARYENLFKGGTVTEQQLDDQRTALENARIQFEQAEKQLSYTKITMPYSGIMTKKSVELGAYVNVGNPVASIVDISKLKVEINVSETVIYQLRVGDNVKITTDAHPGVIYEGKINFVSPKGDAYHNYPVQVEIANNSKYPLKSGTFVNVNVQEKIEGESLSIPRDALVGSIKEASVYVSQNGVAKIRKIVVGRESNTNLEIISGLNEGEKIVVSGQVNLSDNKAIKIVNNK